ncbi:hypothetical protein M3765_11765 [Streptomyces thermoviolaceus]|uniref:hypothetical protein n=1 Tax=Streptomyces thermoviolaceus TaxID=1952 RepID=UPI0020416128|nr:hypothetical protein [Streptomyces thermoviolaceus]MCM3264697.1 hypothetical protein [Streptomyces thermoviolaceus]
MPFVLDVAEDQQRKALGVAERARLSSIRVLEVHAKVLDADAAEELQPPEELTTKLSVGRSDGHLLYRFEHDLTIMGSGDKDALHISLQVGALFDFPEEGTPDGDASEEELAAFGRTTVQMAVYPYVRATVSDLAARTGCGPVTLDLLVTR